MTADGEGGPMAGAPHDVLLRDRLREELASLPVPAPPVAVVVSRGRAMRARRRLGYGSGLAAVAAAVAGMLIAQAPAVARPPRPAAPGPAGQGPGQRTAAPGQPVPGSVFATGSTGGTRWQLAVRDVAATPGTYVCLPAVMLNGRDGDLVAPARVAAAGVASPAYLTGPPAQPAAGYGFVQLGPAVTGLAVTLRNGRQLTATPVTVTACREQFRLAGFSYPLTSGGVTAFTTTAHGGTHTYPAPGATRAAGRPAGVWDNPGRPGLPPTPAMLGAGTAGGLRWQVTVTLGPDGECFAGSLTTASMTSGPVDCLPIGLPPATITLTPIHLPAALTAYAGLVGAGTAHVTATLSGGSTRRLTPVSAFGRKYVVLVAPSQLTITRLTLLDAAGRPIARTTAPPAPG